MTALNVAHGHQGVSDSPYLVALTGMRCDTCKGRGGEWLHTEGERSEWWECETCKVRHRCQDCGRAVEETEEFCPVCWAAGQDEPATEVAAE